MPSSRTNLATSLREVYPIASWFSGSDADQKCLLSECDPQQRRKRWDRHQKEKSNEEEQRHDIRDAKIYLEGILNHL